VWKADGTIDVIDYKFGEEKKSYSKQVKRYVELLEKAGFERVHGYLWYPLNDSANNIQKVI
jgi:RecB family endonuclease NucS